MLPNKVFATFLTDETYLPGIVALNKSLKLVKSAYPLVAFYTEAISKETLTLLTSVGISFIPVEKVIPPESVRNLNLKNGYTRWNETFSKIEIFRQTQFEKIVLLDADVMIVNNIDHLFNAPSMSAVAAGQALNPSWVQLNSGLMIIEPEDRLYIKIRKCLESLDDRAITSFDGLGDQDLIHFAFDDWPLEKNLHLSESYNLFAHYLNIYTKKKILDNKVYVIHFSRSPKPWQFRIRDWFPACIRAFQSRSVEEIKALLQYRALLK